ncbi:AbrB/MazE/SpoVT family DNA-binding domain-containing protein [Bifidobacterium simiarum]|uniref:PbsX family transcriptional regulator n=1 Tax=Bifidobacterium simiarum TaxID=2045441 RepID=A0A2M9HEC9_9BIFI|nr:AbrB/MazE/SpoVT family DNA-binding domain-containing protein [Bifidobacterium simiarum]MBT1165747.1 AbrB/MazE/SpoVT family DNA-binding domain-containing protein [Bifidobacterium simiarum]PJM75180.1 PbsX family transcriptional regulator [Bifidobacterium simiarum]
MATLTLSKWGNAQAVRLPKDLREQVGMTDGSRIEATVRDGAIVLRPIHTDVRVIRVPRLADVFRNRTEEYHATEELSGPAVGEEEL